VLVPQHKSENAEFADKNGTFEPCTLQTGVSEAIVGLWISPIQPQMEVTAPANFQSLDRTAKGCKMNYSFELRGNSADSIAGS
jgi:hypothetical protein